MSRVASTTERMELQNNGSILRLYFSPRTCRKTTVVSGLYCTIVNEKIIMNCVLKLKAEIWRFVNLNSVY